MKKENKELLESLIQNRLEEALRNEDENSAAFREAMEAIDRQLEIDKRELDMQKEECKIQHEKDLNESRQQFEISKEEMKQEFELQRDELNRNFEMNKTESETDLAVRKLDRDTIIKCVEVVAAVLVTPLVEAKCKKTFARMLCEFEKDYNFTTMAGKSLSGLFKFRR